MLFDLSSKHIFLRFQCLGETGIVHSVGDDRAVVEVGEGRPWCWNKQVLRLLAKGGASRIEI